MKNIHTNTYYILFISLLVGKALIYAQLTPVPPNMDDQCVDDGTPGVQWYYYDGDKDGWGSLVGKCLNPSIHSTTYYTRQGGDCNDDNPNIKGPKTWYFDFDRDNLGSPTAPTKIACEQPDRYVANNKDCDDGDEYSGEKIAWYLDGDKDGRAGINSTAVYSCTDPSTETVKYVTAIFRTDCRDDDPAIQQIAWYEDKDGDGFGEAEYVKYECTSPGSNYYRQALDKCPGVFGPDNGCHPAGTDVVELWNTIKVTGYDVKGNVIAQSKSYYDDLGKSVQSQSKDFKTGETWASQTLYDKQGRAALQTLSAPTHRDIPTDFLYKEGFIQNASNSNFTANDFENDPENPKTLGTQTNTVGHYYSINNATEPYQDVTSRPYSRTIYSELNPGAALKTIGGNKIDGKWKNGYVFSMPAGQELSKPDAFAESKYDTYKIIKTVSRDVRGIENVVFTDTDGNTLAAARSGGSGNRTSSVIIGEQGFVDIHIPVGRTGISIQGHPGILYDIFDLITEQKINIAPSSLPNGFYRIAVRDLNNYNANTSVTYPENYYDYSLNYYDKAGRLVKSKQPLQHLESTYTYNSLGQLESTKSPDEGQAWFIYRKDGQIRFSVNSKQLENKQFSYTNYDQRGRPIESGVFTDNDTTPIYVNPSNTVDPFKTALRNIKEDVDGLEDTACSEIHHTIYDNSDNAGLAAAFGADTRKSNYASQSFVAGNVVKTQTLNPETTTTWYSYDIYGRVQWIVQQINGLQELKTIDYVYDQVTSQVTKVYYQKGAPDQFIHRYTYDPADYSLAKVETSVNDTSFTEHATYTYYETGALKRTNIAQGLQGIDYVYNLQGALKSINHPSLDAANDPGGDANDLFGMIIDYNKHDYNRPLPNIKSANYGSDQYNGNIKGIRWNSDYNPILGKEHAYEYTYNQNNWLQKAEYGNFLPDNTSTPTIIDEDNTVTPSANDHLPSVNNVLSSGQTSHLKANVSITLTPGFHAQSGSVFTAKITAGSSNYVRDISAGTLIANANGDYKVDNITYDANGNIQTLHRNKHTENGSNVMDKLEYKYDTANNKPNQLKQVIDSEGDVAGAKDIGTQTDTDNYVYNQIGQLVNNRSENITYLYNASGLVTEVKKGNQPLVKFFYNDKGHRVRKESYNPTSGSLNYIEHYVRDAAGTPMAIYRDGQVVENTIYGASRLGVRKSDGTNVYQLTDHLGNVRVVVGRNPQGQAMAMTSTDYYPFGMSMPGRNMVGDYRYGYQGQEVDPETGKEAFELRLWDSRIGRWLTTDPAGQYSSPYLGMGNNPINGIDVDGGIFVKGNGITQQQFDNWKARMKRILGATRFNYLDTHEVHITVHFTSSPINGGKLAGVTKTSRSISNSLDGLFVENVPIDQTSKNTRVVTELLTFFTPDQRFPIISNKLG
ncbi:RHS repeat-associated core domain-containing protein, partial [bacterium]|nr:RHS repeat-associated core domain-containing protein [bacterium]